MKRYIFIGSALLIVLVLAFGAAGYVYAQNLFGPSVGYQNGNGDGYGCGGYGRGMMGGYAGHRGGYGMMGTDETCGSGHDYMVSALADTLDISAEEIESRLNAGESMPEIAFSEGLSYEEYQALLQSAHDAYLDEAVANGQLSSDQAEWMDERMDEHMDQMWGGGYGNGHCGFWPGVDADQE